MARFHPLVGVSKPLPVQLDTTCRVGRSPHGCYPRENKAPRSVVIRRAFFTFPILFQGIIGPMSKQIHDTRACENCHAQMRPLGKLPAMGAKPSIKVFHCSLCNRIASEPQ